MAENVLTDKTDILVNREEARKLFDTLPPELKRVFSKAGPEVWGKSAVWYNKFTTDTRRLTSLLGQIDGTRVAALKESWYEEKSFLQKTLRGRLVLYLRWLRAQLKNNPVFAIDHRHDFANAIRNQYKDEETAKNIEELKFPTHLGFLDRVKVGVNSWGAAGNINDYVRLSQYYGEQIKKLFGEKAHRIIEKKEGIKHLRWMQEEFLYLGSGRYMSKIDGKEHIGMLFMALKGENEPEWQDFLRMIKKLKGEEHEIKRLFGDRRTVMALIACKKRYGESPQGWIRTLDWLVRRDLPSRYPEVISNAQKEWLEAVKEVEVVVHDELKKDIGKYRGILKKGEDKWIGVWKRNQNFYNTKEEEFYSYLTKFALLFDNIFVVTGNRILKRGEEIKPSLDKEMQLLGWFVQVMRYLKGLKGNDEAETTAHSYYIRYVRQVYETYQNELKTISKKLEGVSDDSAKVESNRMKMERLVIKMLRSTREVLAESEKVYELLNLKKAQEIALPKPAIPTTLPTEEEIRESAKRNYPNMPIDAAIGMEKDRRTREEAMRAAGFPAETPERRTGGPIPR